MKAIVLMLACLGLVGVVHCSSSADSCTAGKACKCDSGNCSQTCGGNGESCTFDCPANGNCTFDCPGGGCGVTAGAGAAVTVKCGGRGGCDVHGTQAKSVAVDCPGNGCGVECGSGTTSCHVTSCKSTCALQCGGSPDCQLSCDPLNGGCTKS